MRTTSPASPTTPTARAFGWLVLACVAGLGGCQSFRSAADPSTRLDTRTGTTVANAGELMVFARLDARYSRSARDYIYLGPAETNRQGIREYFLWVGVASTLDRGFLAPDIGLPTELEMVIGGEPMTFELAAWPPPYVSTQSVDLYQTPVTLRGQLAARATFDQLQLIDASRPDSIRVRGADGRAHGFAVWPTSSGWTRFLSARR